MARRGVDKWLLFYDGFVREGSDDVTAMVGRVFWNTNGWLQTFTRVAEYGPSLTLLVLRGCTWGLSFTDHDSATLYIPQSCTDTESEMSASRTMQMMHCCRYMLHALHDISSLLMQLPTNPLARPQVLLHPWCTQSSASVAASVVVAVSLSVSIMW